SAAAPASGGLSLFGMLPGGSLQSIKDELPRGSVVCNPAGGECEVNLKTGQKLIAKIDSSKNVTALEHRVDAGSESPGKVADDLKAVYGLPINDTNKDPQAGGFTAYGQVPHVQGERQLTWRSDSYEMVATIFYGAHAKTKVVTSIRPRKAIRGTIIMKKLVSAVLAALMLAAVPACSAGDDTGGSNSVSGETGGKTAAKTPKENKLAELSPAEARQQLMERGYTLDQNGFREAVDFLDPDAVALFVALGFDVNAMADALSYPVNRAGAYEESKLPGHLEANLADPAYRAILATLFQNGFSPMEPVRAEASTTSLFAESLRIGDDDFISFLRGFDADWVTKPGCYQHNPRCRNEGTLDGWLFYIPDREPSWDVDTALAAYARLTDLGMAQPVAGEDSDPYLMASLAFQKFLWAR
ncbi:MAG: hypothetical protein KAH44_13470, partial [Oricola sp.]|nr:hypothetical protein [Oricola sp.]